MLGANGEVVEERCSPLFLAEMRGNGGRRISIGAQYRGSSIVEVLKGADNPESLLWHPVVTVSNLLKIAFICKLWGRHLWPVCFYLFPLPSVPSLSCEFFPPSVFPLNGTFGCDEFVFIFKLNA